MIAAIVRIARIVRMVRIVRIVVEGGTALTVDTKEPI